VAAWELADFRVVLAIGLPPPDAQAAVATVMQMAGTGFSSGARDLAHWGIHAGR
jgi:hypothetical protein